MYFRSLLMSDLLLDFKSLCLQTTDLSDPTYQLDLDLHGNSTSGISDFNNKSSAQLLTMANALTGQCSSSATAAVLPLPYQTAEGEPAHLQKLVPLARDHAQ